MPWSTVTSRCYWSSALSRRLCYFALLLLFWVLTWADPSSGEGMGSIIASLSMLNHLENLSRGLLHLKDIVYYASFIGFFLFATWQRVESERWT